MRGVFISYRRQDSQSAAGRLADHLKDHLHGVRVFRDVETIEPGVDFVEAINRALQSSAIMLAVIGPRWMSIADAAGRRRLDDPHDYNRLEVSAALNRSDVRVIPVLVEGAQMPATEDLPEDLKALSRRNAIELTDKRWDYDVGKLVETLDKVLSQDNGSSPEPEPGPSFFQNAADWIKRKPVIAAAGVLGVALLAFALKPDNAPTGGGETPTWQAGKPAPESITDIQVDATSEKNLPEIIKAKPPIPSSPVPMPKPPALDTVAPGKSVPPKIIIAAKPASVPATPAASKKISSVAAIVTPSKLVPLNTQESVITQPKPGPVIPAAEPAKPSIASIPPVKQPVAIPSQRVLLITWGQTTHRNFWSGLTASEYSQRMSSQFESVLREQVTEKITIQARPSEKAAKDMAVKQAVAAIRRACEENGVDWVFAAHAEETFAISSADSAFWPELRMVAMRCGQGNPATAKFSLAPRQGDSFPFSSEMRDAMKDFVRDRQPGKS